MSIGVLGNGNGVSNFVQGDCSQQEEGVWFSFSLTVSIWVGNDKWITAKNEKKEVGVGEYIYYLSGVKFMALFKEQIRYFWERYIYILIAHEIMGREGSFSILSF